MGVAQKTMFSISDRIAKFFGISGAPMEHNAIAKSKQSFFLLKCLNGPGLKGTAARNKAALTLSYHNDKVRVLYFPADVFA